MRINNKQEKKCLLQANSYNIHDNVSSEVNITLESQVNENGVNNNDVNKIKQQLSRN